MLESISKFLDFMSQYSWNLPLIMLLVGTGALFTSLLWFVQARQLKHAFYIIRGDYDDPDDEGDITHFQALCAALSATIGVGNIAGVATALHFGGPGAIFWMWVTAFVGMATKYSTCLLSQKYRHVHSDGTVSGGPMYYIEKGLGSNFKWLAILFAFCAAVASFGGGNMVQSNSMADAFINFFGTPRIKQETSLAELNDGRGIRQTVGHDFHIHTRSGRKIPVDVKGLKTVEDFINVINDNPQNRKERLQAQYEKGRLVILDRTRGEGELAVLPAGSSFDDLGFTELKTEGKKLSSAPISNNLNLLNQGRGLLVQKGPDLVFQLKDGSRFALDLEGVETVEKVAEKINTHRENRLVRASIHLDKKHLRLIDYTNGDEKFHLSPFSQTVSQLDLKVSQEQPHRVYSRKLEETISNDTPLVKLNLGKPVARGEGPDFTFKLHSGSVLAVDIGQAQTVGEFLQAINSHPENNNPRKVVARITPDGHSLVITDLTTGTNELAIQPASSTLKDLWFFNLTADSSRPTLIQTQTPRRTVWRVILGLFIAICVWLVIVGGIKRIGQVAATLVPFMCILYVLGALAILFLHFDQLPSAFGLIFYHAFANTEAVGGGFAGATVIMTLQWGVRRAVFSNEAGLGSAPIAHAAAKTKEPVREGLVAMTGPLIDTIIVCTMTALVIIVTGQWQLGENGAALTQDAFMVGLPGIWGGSIVALGLILFAFSTSISWSYYGDRCVEYLFGKRAITPYRWIFCFFLFLGAFWKLEAVWDFADITMAAMAFPNLIAAVALSGVVLKMTRDYFSREHVPYGRKGESQEEGEESSSQQKGDSEGKGNKSDSSKKGKSSEKKKSEKKGSKKSSKKKGKKKSSSKDKGDKKDEED